MKMLPLVLLCMASAAVAAPPNWLRLGESPRVEVFVDSHSVQRPPGYIKFWTMLQYKSPQEGGWLSEKRLFLYSCKSHALAWQQSMYYSGSLSEGELLDVKTLNRYGSGSFLPADSDPTVGDDNRNYKNAVPESAFISVINGMC